MEQERSCTPNAGQMAWQLLLRRIQKTKAEIYPLVSEGKIRYNT
jgi:hypothetical protein